MKKLFGLVGAALLVAMAMAMPAVAGQSAQVATKTTNDTKEPSPPVVNDSRVLSAHAETTPARMPNHGLFKIDVKSIAACKNGLSIAELLWARVRINPSTQYDANYRADAKVNIPFYTLTDRAANALASIDSSYAMQTVIMPA